VRLPDNRTVISKISTTAIAGTVVTVTLPSPVSRSGKHR